VLHGTLEYMLLTLVFARSSWQQVAKNEPTNDKSVLSEDHLTFVQDNVHQCNRIEVVNNHVISSIQESLSIGFKPMRALGACVGLKIAYIK
jgi:hypothetical protein